MIVVLVKRISFLMGHMALIVPQSKFMERLLIHSLKVWRKVIMGQFLHMDKLGMFIQKRLLLYLPISFTLKHKHYILSTALPIVRVTYFDFNYDLSCGKSFTMQGIQDPPTQRGIIPRYHFWFTCLFRSLPYLLCVPRSCLWLRIYALL